MKRRNKLKHCYRSLTVLRRSTTKYTTKSVGKMLDRLAIVFEVTAFKEAFFSFIVGVIALRHLPTLLHVDVDVLRSFISASCQHWRTHSIPLSPPLRVSFWAWTDMWAKTTHALPDVLDLRTSHSRPQSSSLLRMTDSEKSSGEPWTKLFRYLLLVETKKARLIGQSATR